MQTAPQSNAMAEIALALAMAFFSIMVLSMVSMGAGFSEATTPAPASRDGVPIRAPAGRAGAEPATRNAIAIYYRGRFLDGSLGALRIEALDPAGPLVLAVDPSLSMTEALAARDRLGVEGLTVTTLDEAWLKALEEVSR